MTRKKSSSTIRDVARIAGVSVATVSRYINQTAIIAEETGRHVQAAMDELSFTPHPVARNLATQRTNTIGLLLSDIGGEFYTPLLRGIEAVSSEAGFDLLIHSTNTSHTAKAPRRALNEYNTDGLLIFIDALDSTELTRLSQIGFPLVLMHQSPPDHLNIPFVTIENRRGAQQAVEHLIEVHGRKRIAFLRGPEGNEDSEEREQGYLQALKAHGLPLDPTLVVRGEFETAQAYAVVQQLISQGATFDAVYTGDDDSAIGVIQALKEAGLRVPEDVAIAGFDDSLFARILTPPLTTVRAPIEQVGREAAQQLVRLMREEPADMRTVLPTEMIIRQSCGCNSK
jgi:DNA-binding LacI/PurR family transcriptional regulator